MYYTQNIKTSIKRVQPKNYYFTNLFNFSEAKLFFSPYWRIIWFFIFIFDKVITDIRSSVSAKKSFLFPVLVCIFCQVPLKNGEILLPRYQSIEKFRTITSWKRLIWQLFSVTNCSNTMRKNLRPEKDLCHVILDLE